MVERILYIWAIRHPASGYVQGINDLVTPFLIVFLQEHVDQDVTRSHCEVDSLPEAVRANIEADSFWCMTRVLDGIQDNYTFAQPGIQVLLLTSLAEPEPHKNSAVPVPGTPHCF
jgi:hypothetical protein